VCIPNLVCRHGGLSLGIVFESSTIFQPLVVGHSFSRPSEIMQIPSIYLREEYAHTTVPIFDRFTELSRSSFATLPPAGAASSPGYSFCPGRGCGVPLLGYRHPGLENTLGY